MLQSMIAAAERIFEFLRRRRRSKNINGITDTEDLKGNIEFKHVKFGYNEDKIVINDFSAK